ncbi:glycerol-3-phosphate 1-O-acyltransferase PlsY [Edaphobacter albus]|uniref:glycerol-3-phosphate 1-O-acyltransferase PlsY n=1 Tax=Edaphobacter sp. 4G125 TaxID=2763071 RepID=UPI001647E701|nr:glycerol-3-phosphate 1-O-acyltransferase PlsY [Edaphobacter sp. 4G125]QNI36334.1 glycerol-3-phosphate 1-O-acyltransferase PlsY [Edaphobacter sp. 4G125]
MTPWLISIPLAYLLGSIPFGYLLVRFFRHEDIRTTGSGNIGATNVARSGAKGLGILTLILDALKGYFAVVLAQHLAARYGSPRAYDIAVAAAVAVVLGHCFPVWLGFRGGKGVATALGVFFALVPLITVLYLLGVFLIIVLLTRYVSLASIVAAALFPVFALPHAPARTPVIIAGYIFIPLLVILKHSQNIRRLLSGTEHRFGSRKVAA